MGEENEEVTEIVREKKRFFFFDFPSFLLFKERVLEWVPLGKKKNPFPFLLFNVFSFSSFLGFLRERELMGQDFVSVGILREGQHPMRTRLAFQL